MIARHYMMNAKAGDGDELRAALAILADAVRPLPGCDGVEALRDIADPDRFVFIERWQTVEAHRSAGALLPKDTLAPVMAVLACRPEGGYLEYLETV